MNATRFIAIALIVAGALGLAYGGFTYTRESHEVKIGPIELAVNEKKSVNIPVWAGGGALLIGVVLLATRRNA